MVQVDMGALFGRHLPRLFARAESLGLALGGPPYGRYFAWGRDVADIEIGLVLTGSASLAPLAELPSGEIGRSELPGGAVAIATHVGSYGGLAGTYRRLEAWIVGQGRTILPGPWESYVTDPAGVSDPTQLRTDVCYPLAAATSDAASS